VVGQFDQSSIRKHLFKQQTRNNPSEFTVSAIAAPSNLSSSQARLSPASRLQEQLINQHRSKASPKLNLIRKLAQIPILNSEFAFRQNQKYCVTHKKGKDRISEIYY